MSTALEGRAQGGIGGALERFRPHLARCAGAVRRAAPALLVLGAAATVLLSLALDYLPFFADDAFISLRYARRLVDGHGLTWTDGERVEGYSNLLWILCCSAVSVATTDLVTAARVLGVLCVLAAAFAITLAHRPRGFKDMVPPLAGALSLAIAGPISVWAIGGLEQPLLLCLLAWGLVRAYPLLDAPDLDIRAALPSATLFGLMCWTRLDAPVLVAGAGLGLLVARGPNLRALRGALCFLLVPAGFVLAQAAFRAVYYGEVVPNTARVKVVFSSARLEEGLAYLSGAVMPLLGVLIAALAAAVATAVSREYRRRCVLLVIPLVLWCSYLVVVGGDIFPARRQLVPALGICALLIALGAELAVARLGRPTALRWLVVISLLHYASTKADPALERAKSESWEWPGEPIGALLQQAFGASSPLLAVDAAGSLPYFSGLPSLDMLGLNDRHISRQPRQQGAGLMGHDLGDGQYVLARRPDLIVFGIPESDGSPRFKGGFEMTLSPEFARDYHLVTLEAPLKRKPGSSAPPGSVTSVVWVRKQGRIGVRDSGQNVSVPAVLIGEREHTARIDSTGRLGLAITSDRPVNYRDAKLSPGRWQLEIIGSGAELVSSVQSDGGARVSGNERLEFEVTGREPQQVVVEVRVASGAAHVVALEFSRRPAKRALTVPASERR